MMKAPLTFRTWLVFSPADGCSTENSRVGGGLLSFFSISVFLSVTVNSWESVQPCKFIGAPDKIEEEEGERGKKEQIDIKLKAD